MGRFSSARIGHATEVPLRDASFVIRPRDSGLKYRHGNDAVFPSHSHTQADDNRIDFHVPMAAVVAERSVSWRWGMFFPLRKSGGANARRYYEQLQGFCLVRRCDWLSGLRTLGGKNWQLGFVGKDCLT